MRAVQIITRVTPRLAEYARRKARSKQLTVSKWIERLLEREEENDSDDDIVLTEEDILERLAEARENRVSYSTAKELIKSLHEDCQRNENLKN
jgi:hypothetical protein